MLRNLGYLKFLRTFASEFIKNNKKWTIQTHERTV